MNQNNDAARLEVVRALVEQGLYHHSENVTNVAPETDVKMLLRLLDSRDAALREAREEIERLRAGIERMAQQYERVADAQMVCGPTAVELRKIARPQPATPSPVPPHDELQLALAPFAALGGAPDMQAYHDQEDDVVLYKNSGHAITAGDVRAARRALGTTSEMNFRSPPSSPAPEYHLSESERRVMQRALRRSTRLVSPGATDGGLPEAATNEWQPGMPRCDFCDNGLNADWAFCPYCSRVVDASMAVERAPPPLSLTAAVDSGTKANTKDLERAREWLIKNNYWEPDHWGGPYTAADREAASLAAALSARGAEGRLIVGEPEAPTDNIDRTLFAIHHELTWQEARQALIDLRAEGERAGIERAARWCDQQAARAIDRAEGHKSREHMRAWSAALVAIETHKNAAAYLRALLPPAAPEAK